jgi:hypothetical protein
MPNKWGQNTDTHSECVILSVFPLQQWLHEIAWMLCYTALPVLFFSAHWNVQLMLTSVFQSCVPSVFRNPFGDVFVSLSVACLRSNVMSLNMNRIYTLVEPTNKMASRLRSVKGVQPQNKTPAFTEPNASTPKFWRKCILNSDLRNTKYGDILSIVSRHTGFFNRPNYKCRISNCHKKRDSFHKGYGDETCNFNPLQTKSRLLYLNTQLISRSEHFSTRL